MQKILSFLKKVPSWVLMLALFVSLFLRDLTGNLTINHTMLVDMINEMAVIVPTIAPAVTQIVSMEWLFWILQAGIYFALFELFSSAVIAMAMGRRALQIPKSEIMHSFRLFYIAATLVSMLLSLFLLVLPAGYAVYWMELVKIPVYVAAYILFYWFIGKNCIVYPQKAYIWKMAATLVSVYFVVTNALNFFSVVTAESYTTADLVMNILALVLSALAAGAMFYFYTVVKKDEIKNPPAPPEVEEEEKVEIFKGFGF